MQRTISNHSALTKYFTIISLWATILYLSANLSVTIFMMLDLSESCKIKDPKSIAVLIIVALNPKTAIRYPLVTWTPFMLGARTLNGVLPPFSRRSVIGASSLSQKLVPTYSYLLQDLAVVRRAVFFLYQRDTARSRMVGTYRTYVFIARYFIFS